MSEGIHSTTKTKLTDKQIQHIIATHFDEDVLDIKEVAFGMYNSIYIITTPTDEYVIKIAPNRNVDILSYEQNIIKKEIYLYQKMMESNIPVPTVLAIDFSKKIIDNDYYVMSKLRGDPLFHFQGNKEPYYIELMQYIALLHNNKSTYFGYASIAEQQTHSKAIFAMFKLLLNDANRINLKIPDYLQELIDYIFTQSTLLDQVKEATLLHFDLWDGNILIDNFKITGLIDAERGLSGDPIAEFVPMNFDLLDPKNIKYLNEYNKYATRKIELNNDTIVRYLVYKTYLFALMFVESDFRQVNGSYDGQRNWVISVLKELHTKLISL